MFIYTCLCNDNDNYFERYTYAICWRPHILLSFSVFLLPFAHYLIKMTVRKFACPQFLFMISILTGGFHLPFLYVLILPHHMWNICLVRTSDFVQVKIFFFCLNSFLFLLFRLFVRLSVPFSQREVHCLQLWNGPTEIYIFHRLQP